MRWEKNATWCKISCIKWKQRRSRCIWREKRTTRGHLKYEMTASDADWHVQYLKRQQCAIQPTWCIQPPASLLLSLPPHLLTSPQSSTETGQETHSPPCFSLATFTARLQGKTESRRALRQSPRDVWKRARALPGRCKAMPGDVTYQLGATGRFATAYCAPSQSVFPLSYQVTPTADLCVLFLLAVSNHSPAVCFIRTASVIPVKCSA